MKIIETKDLELDGVMVVRFGRFLDQRGYFTEHFRKSDLAAAGGFPDFVQCNESFSRAGVVRGLHLQWDPYMGKLVRTVRGRMVDLVLDIRKGSPTLGKVIAYDLPESAERDYGEWIWVPPGFAHGTFFTEDSLIEYFCTGEYSPGNEAGISPFAPDIDWSLCDGGLKRAFDDLSAGRMIISDRDREGFSLAAWSKSPASDKFVYGKLPS